MYFGSFVPRRRTRAAPPAKRFFIFAIEPMWPESLAHPPSLRLLRQRIPSCLPTDARDARLRRRVRGSSRKIAIRSVGQAKSRNCWCPCCAAAMRVMIVVPVGQNADGPHSWPVSLTFEYRRIQCTPDLHAGGHHGDPTPAGRSRTVVAAGGFAVVCSMCPCR